MAKWEAANKPCEKKLDGTDFAYLQDDVTLRADGSPSHLEDANYFQGAEMINFNISYFYDAINKKSRVFFNLDKEAPCGYHSFIPYESILMPRYNQYVEGGKIKTCSNYQVINNQSVQDFCNVLSATSADIRQYYPTCNPDTIIRILCKYIKDKWVISLSKEFLSLGYVVLGNISSNILGHINLLDIDYSIVRNFKCDYLRFCDDTIFISNNKQAVRSAVTYYMQKVTEGGQTVKPNWSIHKVSDKNMVDFLGVRIGTTHRKLRKRNRKEIESRLSELKRSSDFFECERSWAGMNGSFKNINMSNLINYWKDVYPDFFDRLQWAKTAHASAAAYKRKHRKMEIELQSAKDCRTYKIPFFGNAGFNPDGTMAVLFRTIGQHKRC